MTDLLDPTGVPRRRRRAPRRGLRVALALVVLVVVLAGVLVGGTLLLGRLRGPDAPDYTGTGNGSVVVQVTAGQTAADIGRTLVEAGVVRSTGAFSLAATDNPASRGLAPGSYTLRRQMSASSALTLLLDPASRLRNKVTLPEGAPLVQALATIARDTRIPMAQLKAAVQSPQALGLPAYAKGQVEGFLFPATYDVEPGTTATQLLTTMVARYTQAAAELDLEARARALGLTPYEVLTTASLIEKETAYPADRPKVARVVYNRLKIGMRLQFDSTVNYLRTEKKANLSLDDIKVESDYNTYQVSGLPPTPIDSPGAEAIQAALTPATGDYVFFITISKSGQALFTKDYQEFLRAKAKSQADGVY